MSLSLIICSLLALGIAAGVMAKPLFLNQDKPYFDGQDQKEHEFDPSLALLESIQELESDLATGKLTQEEFNALANEAKWEYLELKKQKQQA